MEPNKLEKQFKEQLNSREIQPSEMAWSRLDSMLTAADPSNSEQAKRKSKTKFPWMYIAASFIGFLLIGTVYFSQNKNAIENQMQEVVIQNSATPEITVVPDNKVKLKTEGEKITSTTVVSKTNSGSAKSPILKEKSNIVAPNLNQSQVAEVSIRNHSKENRASDNSFQDKNYQSTGSNRYVSAEKLLAEVTNTKFEPNATDKVIEKSRKAISVNPNSLLSSAETELNQSFRESALNRLNKNFNAIKTVLVNRNYEE